VISVEQVRAQARICVSREARPPSTFGLTDRREGKRGWAGAEAPARPPAASERSQRFGGGGRAWVNCAGKTHDLPRLSCTRGRQPFPAVAVALAVVFALSARGVMAAAMAYRTGDTTEDRRGAVNDAVSDAVVSKPRRPQNSDDR